MELRYETNPLNYDEFNVETSAHTSNSIISISEKKVMAFDVLLRTEYKLTALRVLNRKKYTLDIILKDISILTLDKKTKLVTLFSDDDFIVFSNNLDKKDI